MFKNTSKNKEFYKCYKSGKGCHGKEVYDKVNKVSQIYEEWVFKIQHIKYKYIKIQSLYDKNELNTINMNIKNIKDFILDIYPKIIKY